MRDKNVNPHSIRNKIKKFDPTYNDTEQSIFSWLKTHE
jgi:hypothetical protein